MSYKVIKNALGGYRVAYDCPTCGVRLRSPLKEAGSVQSCPDCGNAIPVPGRNEWATIQEKRRMERDQKMAAEEQQRKERIEQRVDKAKAKLERQAMAKQERDWKRQAVAKSNAAAEERYNRRRDKAIHPALVIFLPGTLCLSVIGWESKRYPSFALVINLLSMLVMIASFLLSLFLYVAFLRASYLYGVADHLSRDTNAIACFAILAWMFGHIISVAVYMGGIEMALMLADIESNTRQRSQQS